MLPPETGTATELQANAKAAKECYQCSNVEYTSVVCRLYVTVKRDSGGQGDKAEQQQ